MNRACLGEARAAGGRLATGDPSDPRMFWWPTTIDLRAEAERRGVPLAVANFTALVAAIRRYRNLTNLYWFGHGAARELQFGGAVFRAGDIPSLGGVDLSPHLSAGATIAFLACNAGQSPDLMRGIANAPAAPDGFRCTHRLPAGQFRGGSRPRASGRLAAVVIPTVIPTVIPVAMRVIAVPTTPAALAAATVTAGEKRHDHKYDPGGPASLARSRLWSSNRFHIHPYGDAGPQDKTNRNVVRFPYLETFQDATVPHVPVRQWVLTVPNGALTRVVAAAVHWGRVRVALAAGRPTGARRRRRLTRFPTEPLRAHTLR